MGHLHELLAVEGDLKGAKDKIREETINTFSKKDAHFTAFTKHLKMFDESRKHEEAAAEERKELVTTVQQKLDYMSDAFIKHWDAKLRKEEANTRACADVVVDGLTLAKGVPATFLLSMEEELKQLRKVYEAIPTLQPGISWVKDPILGDDVYRAEHPEINHKTEKTIQHKIIVQPTKEHPAQVEKWTEDHPIGQYILERWSGMLSPAEKSLILGKLDSLIRAVKKARQRANDTEVADVQIGKILFDFINS